MTSTLQPEPLLGPKIIRSEAHALRTSPAMREDVERTISFYRRVVKMASTIAMTHWPEIGSLPDNESAKALERLIHPTAKRPVVRYAVVSRALGKMPSYLRRAALEHAVGCISSFMSNYSNWIDELKDGSRSAGAKPPKLGFSNVFPTLYGGNMIEVGTTPAARQEVNAARVARSFKKSLTFMGPMRPVKKIDPLKGLPIGMVRIKLLMPSGEWEFCEPLKSQGKRKRLPNDGSMDLSPSLMQRGAKVWLSCPVAMRPPRYVTNKSFKAYIDGRAQSVCSIDVGINTAATAAIVDSTGTVISRKFFTCGRHNDQRDRLQGVIAQKQSQTVGSTDSKVGQGFCAALHRRIAGLSKDAARRLASEIAAFAQEHGARAIVIEDLKGWKPKGPSRKQRKRFHRFQHRMLVECLKHQAAELGMRVLEVYARGTSRWAYDGSGKVARSKENAQLATFASGKQYNADLNGALNIAGRGLAMLLGIKVETGKRPESIAGMPLVLSDVWKHHRTSVDHVNHPGPLEGVCP
jgi:IS605 OrfB family transposase